MRNKNPKFLFLLVLLFLHPTFANANVNAGFVNGVWYSKTPFFASETIRIYAAIQNRSNFDVLGKVNFYDGNTFLGEYKFTALSGRLIEAWIDWKVTPGDHNIYTKILDAKKSEPGKAPEVITLESPASQESKIFADLDTDGDGVGNLVDTDDDNDKIPDSLEISKGTDPLMPNKKLPTIVTETKVEIPEMIVAQIIDSSKEVVPIIDRAINQSLEIVTEAKEKTEVEIEKIETKNLDQTKIQNKKEEGLKFAIDFNLIWLKIKLAILSALSLILSYKMVFYTTFIIFLFFLIKFILKLIL